MDSEKVKEIKKALEVYCKENKGITILRGGEIQAIPYADILTLINELESENERLSKELDSEWKGRRKAEENLHRTQWNYKIGLGQSRKRNKELKDLINELESKNEKLLDSVETVQSNRCTTKCELTKRARNLKGV